jgi:hypothetical protein
MMTGPETAPKIPGVESSAMADERIMARRVTLDEFCSYMGKLEYIQGGILTGPGIELFMGVKEFPESIRALEDRKRVLKGDGE